MTEEELKKAEKKKASAAKTAKNARIKKLKNQLKGLDFLASFFSRFLLISSGTSQMLNSFPAIISYNSARLC